MDNQILRIEKQGNCGLNGGPSGDIIIKLSVDPDTYYTRDGVDIYSDCWITIAEAVNGTLKTIDSL